MLTACGTSAPDSGRPAAPVKKEESALCQSENISITSREIYFDIDSVSLDSEAEATLQDLAEDIKKSQPSRVVVHGYADRSGPEAHNLRLSRQRATAVAAALKKMGVPGSLIRTGYCGEEGVAVPTNDGVKILENRRVVIQMEK